MTDKNEALDEAVLQMSDEQVQELRDSYYKAVEGVEAFRSAIKSACRVTVRPGEERKTALEEEFSYACAACNAIDKSDLGSIL